MRRNHLRFLFSQLSAITVFLVVLFVGVFLLRGLGVHPTGWFVLGVVAGLVLVSALTTALWGKVLVWLGVLSAEEARGYPYSKPWEHDDAV
jgi:hypothetical protein